MEYKEDKVFFLSNHTNKVLQCTKDGELRCTNENRGVWEAFQILNQDGSLGHVHIAKQRLVALQRKAQVDTLTVAEATELEALKAAAAIQTADYRTAATVRCPLAPPRRAPMPITPS
jgi:hypothetical protein